MNTDPTEKMIAELERERRREMVIEVVNNLFDTRFDCHDEELKPENYDLNDIEEVVCKNMHVDIITLKENIKTRKREVVQSRQHVIYLVKKLNCKTLHECGLIYKKDHATALHSINVINNLLNTDKTFKTLFINVMAEIVDKKLRAKSQNDTK